MTETRVIGTCSLCGGAVVQVTVYFGVGPFPPPYCSSCHATKKRPHGPVIDMDSESRPAIVSMTVPMSRNQKLAIAHGLRWGREAAWRPMEGE